MEIDHGAGAVADGSGSSAAAPPSASRVVFPGDELSVSGTGIRLSNGLMQSSMVTPINASTATDAKSIKAGIEAQATPQGQVTVTKCGVLKKGPVGKLWVDNTQKRYIAAVDDLVLGVIIEKHGEAYKIDIGTTQPAILPALAFEGATKRNKPNLPVGALVYARVSIAHKDIEVELSCTSPHFKKDWVTGQSLYGELLGGYSFTCSTRLARDLLREDCYVLAVVGKFVPFEVAIGLNGRVWVNSGSPLHTILITNAIINSEGKSKEHITSMVAKIMQAL